MKKDKVMEENEKKEIKKVKVEENKVMEENEKKEMKVKVMEENEKKRGRRW